MANYFERALSQGDDVLYVGMSGGISGTAQAAVIAAGELTEKYPARRSSRSTPTLPPLARGYRCSKPRA